MLTVLSRTLKSREFTTDMFFMQKHFFSMIDSINYLDGQFKRYKESTVYKLADVYYEFSEIYAKILTIIRILLSAIEGNFQIDIKKTYNDNLSDHVGKIRGNKDFEILGDIDFVIRNALSHETYQYDRDQKSIFLETENRVAH
ncbi:MAG: hypothetical protein QXE05_12455 [Nitrososphaeria archaeon]